MAEGWFFFASQAVVERTGDWVSLGFDIDFVLYTVLYFDNKLLVFYGRHKDLLSVRNQFRRVSLEKKKN